MSKSEDNRHESPEDRHLPHALRQVEADVPDRHLARVGRSSAHRKNNGGGFFSDEWLSIDVDRRHAEETSRGIARAVSLPHAAAEGQVGQHERVHPGGAVAPEADPAAAQEEAPARTAGPDALPGYGHPADGRREQTGRSHPKKTVPKKDRHEEDEEGGRQESRNQEEGHVQAQGLKTVSGSSFHSVSRKGHPIVQET